MRKKIKSFIENLEQSFDAATEKLDNLSRKLNHGIDTATNHLDQRLNEEEGEIIKKMQETDEKPEERLQDAP